MSRGCFLALVLSTTLMILPRVALAQTGEEKYLGDISLGASIGYAIPTTDEYDNAAAFKITAGYSITPYFNLEAGLGRFSSTVSQPDANGVSMFTIASGDLRVIPLTLTGQFRYQVPEIFSIFYGLAGLGYYFVDYSWSDDTEAYFESVKEAFPAFSTRVKQEVDNGFGFHLGGGLDYLLTSQLSLNIEAQYILFSPKARGFWKDLEDGTERLFDNDLDLNTFLFTAGIKFWF